MKKPVSEIIQDHSADFDSLRCIEEVEVLGFSYSQIDRPYLDRIIKETGKDIRVRLGWHDEKTDKDKAESFARELELSNYELIKF